VLLAAGSFVLIELISSLNKLNIILFLVGQLINKFPLFNIRQL
jgi:hypothetical protein